MSGRAEKNKLVQEKCQQILAELLRDDDNKYCVDCDAKGKVIPLGSGILIYLSFVCFSLSLLRYCVQVLDGLPGIWVYLRVYDALVYIGI